MAFIHARCSARRYALYVFIKVKRKRLMMTTRASSLEIFYEHSQPNHHVYFQCL